MKNKSFILLLIILFVLASAAAKECMYNNKQLDKLCKDAEENIYLPCAINKVNAFLKEAEHCKNQDAISEAYKQKIYVFALNICNMDSAKYYMERMITRFPKQEEKLLSAKKFLIYGYQDAGKYNLAVTECKKILNTSKSQREIVEAYFALVELYYQSGNNEMADKNIHIVCNYVEKKMTRPQTKHYKLAQLYTYGGLINNNLKRDKQAKLYFEKADSIARTEKEDAPSMKSFRANFLWYGWALYYLEIKDIKQMNVFINKLKKEGSDDSYRYMYSILKDYNLEYKQYAKASQAIDSLVAVKDRMGIESYDIGYYEERARVCAGLGQKDEALKYYAICYIKQDSVLKDRDRITASEFAEMLQTNNLKAEKNELALKLNHHQIIFLCVTLGFAIALIILLIRWSIHQKRAKMVLSKAHDELQKAYEQVEQLSNMKSSFIKNMSHEIRTPLNGIVGFAGIISTLAHDNPECAQYAKIIEDESVKLLKILNDVIELSSIESDVMEKQPLSLHNCCLTSINRAEELKKREVQFEYLPSDEHILVDANEQGLVQVFENILNNSFKFTAKGKVTMEYHKEGKNVVIITTDTGCGIPEDKQDWVFERFSKVNLFTQGSGLGLAICKLIMVEKLGGNIIIDKSYKDGCRIIVTIAAAK